MRKNLRDKVLELREKGFSISAITRELGCSYSSVEYWLYPRMRARVIERAAKRVREKGHWRKTEKGRKYYREYYMRRYRSEPDFRRKVIDCCIRYNKRKRLEKKSNVINDV